MYLTSPRRVVFTKHEVFYDDSHSASESYETIAMYWTNNNRKTLDGVDWILNRPRTPIERLCYARLVGKYTSRLLTHVGDRLDAFVGIMGRLEPWVTEPSQMAALNGLPQYNFAGALTWSQVDNPGEGLYWDARGKRRLPSWSWVGWTGTVPKISVWTNYRMGPHATIRDRANVILTTIKPPMH